MSVVGTVIFIIMLSLAGVNAAYIISGDGSVFNVLAAASNLGVAYWYWRDEL